MTPVAFMVLLSRRRATLATGPLTEYELSRMNSALQCALTTG